MDTNPRTPIKPGGPTVRPSEHYFRDRTAEADWNKVFDKNPAVLDFILRRRPVKIQYRKRLHLELNKTRPSPNGSLAFELGAKVGWWPCLHGPFISIQLGFRRIDFWYGTPRYWKEGTPPS